MRGQNSRSRNEMVRLPWAAEDAEDVESIHCLGIRLITLLAGLIGIWGLLCLLAGLTHSGGLAGLGAGWLSAILGY